MRDPCRRRIGDRDDFRTRPLWPTGADSFAHRGGGLHLRSYDSDIHQLANLEPPGRDLITLHVYSPPLARMRLYSLDDTTLAHHDDMIALRPQTIVATVRTNGSQGRFDTALAQRSGKTP